MAMGIQKKNVIDRNKYRRRKRSHKGIILLAVAVILLVGIGLFLFFRFRVKPASAEFEQTRQASEISDAERNALLADITIISSVPEQVGQTLELSDVEQNVLPEETYVPYEDGKTIVVLDAGHGGKDGGTISGDVCEKDINLAVVTKIKMYLEGQVDEVILTREDDSFLKLDERVRIANEANADLFMSVHCNYYEDDSAVKGLECYFKDGSTKGQLFAEGILSHVRDAGGVKVRSAKSEDYKVISDTGMPAVLIEMGFLSNPDDCKNLTKSDYQDKLAKAFADTILENLPKPED